LRFQLHLRFQVVACARQPRRAAQRQAAADAVGRVGPIQHDACNRTIYGKTDVFKLVHDMTVVAAVIEPESCMIHNRICLLQERFMSAYLIVDTKIENAEEYDKYKALERPIAEKYGGVYRARGGAMDVLETDLWTPTRMVTGVTGHTLVEAGHPIGR
jgi:hypothetical protein